MMLLLILCVLVAVALVAFGVGCAAYARLVDDYQEQIDDAPEVDRGDRPPVKPLQPVSPLAERSTPPSDPAP